jgi:ABC-type antimicrobial peptide transport system permease subunit
MQILLVILLLIVTIGMVNTTLMGVMERMREFGVILALGATPARLKAMVLTEALLLGILAAVAGTLLGCLTSWYLVTVGIDLRAFLPEGTEYGGVVFDPVLRARWNPDAMLAFAVAIPALAVLASLYPAMRAGRIKPVRALYFD